MYAKSLFWETTHPDLNTRFHQFPLCVHSEGGVVWNVVFSLDHQLTVCLSDNQWTHIGWIFFCEALSSSEKSAQSGNWSQRRSILMQAPANHFTQSLMFLSTSTGLIQSKHITGIGLQGTRHVTDEMQILLKKYFCTGTGHHRCRWIPPWSKLWPEFGVRLDRLCRRSRWKRFQISLSTLWVGLMRQRFSKLSFQSDEGTCPSSRWWCRWPSYQRRQCRFHSQFPIHLPAAKSPRPHQIWTSIDNQLLKKGKLIIIQASIHIWSRNRVSKATGLWDRCSSIVKNIKNRTFKIFQDPPAWCLCPK